MADTKLADKIKAYIEAEPRHFADVVTEFNAYPYREVLYAWSELREQKLLARDREGHYLIK